MSIRDVQLFGSGQLSSSCKCMFGILFNCLFSRWAIWMYIFIPNHYGYDCNWPLSNYRYGSDKSPDSFVSDYMRLIVFLKDKTTTTLLEKKKRFADKIHPHFKLRRRRCGSHAAARCLRRSAGNNYRGDEREECNCNYMKSFFLSQQKQSPSYEKVVWFASVSRPRYRIPSWELRRSQLNPQPSTLMVEGCTVN